MWGSESESRIHSFMGMLARCLHQDVAGVGMLAPGWVDFSVTTFLPRARDLEQADYHLQGPCGALGATWRRGDDHLGRHRHRADARAGSTFRAGHGIELRR